MSHGRRGRRPRQQFVPLAAVFALAALPLLAPSGAGGATPVGDRDPGIPMSQFGVFVEHGQWLLYPFYEYTRTTAFEYQPRELGSVGSADHLGKLVEREALLWVAYGLSDRVAFELEGALHTRATFDKAPDDPSAVPARLEESGLGDVEGQLRWLWNRPAAGRPQLYSYWEVVFPFQKDKQLIGTQDWESSLGIGWLQSFGWGTVGGRVALAYDGNGSQLELGEYALEYMRAMSPRWRLVTVLEGESDELSLIAETQWHFSDHAFAKLNCGFGLTQKAPDIAPEVGVVFRFGP